MDASVPVGDPASRRSDWTAGPVGSGDFARWRELYLGYAAFYRVPMPEPTLLRVWGWLSDHAHPVEALLARSSSGVVAGLAHYRPFPRPLAGSTGCFLDDLYVDPDFRGQGVADELLAALRTLAGQRAWSVVRWITAEDNHQARAKYDQVAVRTGWVTYDMQPVAGPGRDGQPP